VFKPGTSFKLLLFLFSPEIVNVRIAGASCFADSNTHLPLLSTYLQHWMTESLMCSSLSHFRDSQQWLMTPPCSPQLIQLLSFLSQPRPRNNDIHVDYPYSHGKMLSRPYHVPGGISGTPLPSHTMARECGYSLSSCSCGGLRLGCVRLQQPCITHG